MDQFQPDLVRIRAIALAMKCISEYEVRKSLNMITPDNSGSSLPHSTSSRLLVPSAVRSTTVLGSTSTPSWCTASRIIPSHY